MMLNAFIFTATSLKRSGGIAMAVTHRTKKDQRKKKKRSQDTKLGIPEQKRKRAGGGQLSSQNR